MLSLPTGEQWGWNSNGVSLLRKSKLSSLLSVSNYPFVDNANIDRTPWNHRTIGNKQFVFCSLGNKRQDNEAAINIAETGYFPFKIYMVNTHCQVFLDSTELSLTSINAIQRFMETTTQTSSVCLVREK